MRFTTLVVLAMFGWLGCGDDDGAVPAVDGGTDAGGRDDAGGPPADSGAANDAGPDLTECDLRDPEPCPGDSECVTLHEEQADWMESPDHIRARHVCREGLRIAEGLPCAFEPLPDREGWTRSIDNCTEGTWCNDVSGETVCRRYCGPDLATCDPGAQCLSSGRFLDDRIGVCVPDEAVTGCDAVLQDDCPAGEVCFFLRSPDDPSVGAGYCYPSAGLPARYEFNYSVGKRCDVVECTYGQACIEEAGEWTCRKLCDTTGATSTEISPDGAPWGTCPSSAPTCVPMFPGLPTPAGYCDGVG